MSNKLTGGAELVLQPGESVTVRPRGERAVVLRKSERFMDDYLVRMGETGEERRASWFLLDLEHRRPPVFAEAGKGLPVAWDAWPAASGPCVRPTRKATGIAT